jgi:uncharacterized protein (UPF0548 family)
MFLTRRPTPQQIEEFIQHSRNLALSYQPIGIANETLQGFRTDESNSVIGHGRPAFERAILALKTWKQFELGWVELFPRGASMAVGAEVAVLIHHLGFWSLNGSRVVYSIGDEGSRQFGFAYGTLTNHSESGEEIFEVSLSDRDEVIYRIRAASKPRAALARIGYPYARLLQARFRRDSTRALENAILGIR